MDKEEKREGRDTMQKEEFEDLVGQALSDRDYEIIETVYLYHPAIRDVSGKEEVAELYKSFGMVIFYDLIGRAKKNQELEEQLRHAQAEVDRIKEEMVQNRASMVRKKGNTTISHGESGISIHAKQINLESDTCYQKAL